MNKLHVLALTGLMVCGINNASMMGQEQREVLYTLNTLGQDFSNVPMIAQNIDMFKGVLEMNIQVNEAKLKDANKNMKTALWKNASLLAGTIVGQFIFNVGLETAKSAAAQVGYNSLSMKTITGLLIQGSITCRSLMHICAALNIYDAGKNRSALVEAIALDKEILSKLEEIDASMDFLTETPAE